MMYPNDEQLPRLLATMCTCLDKPMRLNQHLISVLVLGKGGKNTKYWLPSLTVDCFVSIVIYCTRCDVQWQHLGADLVYSHVGQGVCYE